MVIKPLVLALGLCLGSAAFANNLGIQRLDISNIDPAVIEQARQVSEQGQKTAGAVTEEDMAWLQKLTESTASLLPAPEDADEDEAAPEAERKHPLGDGKRTLIFVSWSMGATAIKDIMAAYDGRPATGIVFRGIPDGMKMIDAVTKMHMLTKDTMSEVSVLLDPLAFKRHAIDVVPAIVIESEDDALLAKALGTTSARLLESGLEEGKGPDLGTHGPTGEILEPDLMEVAKQRIAELDTEAMKKRAIDRFWVMNTGTPLPPVIKPARRLVDPSVIIPQDILDSKGNVVTKAGKINPLEVMPFDQKLVVIDPTQPWQVQLAIDEYKSHGIGMTVTVMATQIPPDSGWELFNAVQDRIDGPLYVLPGDMAERFQIQRTPSIVTAEGMNFVVREVAKEEVEVADAAQ